MTIIAVLHLLLGSMCALRRRAELAAAFELTYRSYLGKGYVKSHPGEIVYQPVFGLSSTRTLIALAEPAGVIGTLSVVGDNVYGLQMEKAFPEEVDSLRDRGRSVCEITCLAIESVDRFRPTAVFFAITKFMLHYALSRGYDDLLMTVHPRHYVFYWRHYRAYLEGSCRPYAAANGNPAVCCRIDLRRPEAEHERGDARALFLRSSVALGVGAAGNASGGPSLLRHAERHCRWCWFFGPCGVRARRGLIRPHAWPMVHVLPIALKALIADRSKLLTALVGVVFSIVLVNIQGGLFLGLIMRAGLLVDNSQADIWVGHRLSHNVDFPRDIPRRWIARVRGIPGVERAEPYLIGWAEMTLPSGGFESVVIVGLERGNELGAPWNLMQGDLNLLRETDGILFDECEQAKLEYPQIGDSRELAGRRARGGDDPGDHGVPRGTVHLHHL